MLGSKIKIENVSIIFLILAVHWISSRFPFPKIFHEILGKTIKIFSEAHIFLTTLKRPYFYVLRVN